MKINILAAFVFLASLAVGGTQAQDTPEQAPARALPQAEKPEVKQAEKSEPLSADDRARKAFGPPPGCVQLGKTNNLWMDKKRKRVYADGYVSLRNGGLEMFACPAGTKEHESAVAILARSIDVHTALLAIGAQTGTPVQHVPRFVPATGQVIRVWVCWRDKKGKFQAVDARTWVKKVGTKKETMKSEWVFAGSGFWTDPSNGEQHYEANAGDMICVSNFSTAMIDVSIASSAEAGQLLYVPFTERIPEEGTSIRMVLVAIPPPSDKPIPNRADFDKKPVEAILPKTKS